MKTCHYFPETECDEMCPALGCGQQGLIIHMREQGVPECELQPMDSETSTEPQP
jgi:hypothetical protein